MAPNPNRLSCYPQDKQQVIVCLARNDNWDEKTLREMRENGNHHMWRWCLERDWRIQAYISIQSTSCKLWPNNHSAQMISLWKWAPVSILILCPNAKAWVRGLKCENEVTPVLPKISNVISTTQEHQVITLFSSSESACLATGARECQSKA